MSAPMNGLPRHIQTNRLTLRVPTEDDAPFWERLSALEEVRAAVGLVGLDEATRRWREDGEAMYIACLTATGESIGLAGFAAPFRKEGHHLLCALAREYRGRIDGGTTLAGEACASLIEAWHAATRAPLFAHIERDPDAPGRRDGRVQFVVSLGGVPVGVSDDWDSEKFYDFEFP